MPAPVADELKVRSQNFGVILYPNEDSNHRNFIDYVSSHDRLFKCVWIEHDKDLDKDGNPKKHHVHMLVYHKKQWSVSAFLKFFAGWIDYAEPVYSAESYIAYMCHDTPDSKNKVPYSPNLLHGDKKLISKVFGQNPYFVQLGEFAEQCRSGANISDIILDTLCIDDINKRKIAQDTFDKYSNIICYMSNQEKNDRKSKRYEDAEYYPQVSITD